MYKNNSETVVEKADREKKFGSSFRFQTFI